MNYAIAMQPGNKAYYVQADATSFDAQMQELQSLEGQMSTLGVTKLFGQKFVAESAEANASTKRKATPSWQSSAKNSKAPSTKPSP